MARKKKVKVETSHHQMRVLAIIPIIITALLYTITVGEFSEGSIFWNILAAVALGSLIGAGVAYYGTTDNGVLDLEEKQESITTGILVFSGATFLFIMTSILPKLQSIWNHERVQETFISIFQKENFEKIMWNVLYLVMGYITTILILMKSVPAIARKFGELEDDALAEPEEDDTAAVPTAATGTTGATAAPATGTATTPAKKTEEKSGRWIAWVGGTVLLLVILSTVMNSGTPSKKSDSEKGDSVNKTEDRPKHQEKKKKSELDEDFVNTLRKNGEREPEKFSVDLTEQETASEEGERFGD